MWDRVLTGSQLTPKSRRSAPPSSPPCFCVSEPLPSRSVGLNRAPAPLQVARARRAVAGQGHPSEAGQISKRWPRTPVDPRDVSSHLAAEAVRPRTTAPTPSPSERRSRVAVRAEMGRACACAGLEEKARRMMALLSIFVLLTVRNKKKKSMKERRA
jgi:hypothetical protein